MRPYLYTFIPIPAAATRPYPLMITNLLDRVKFPFRKDKELLSALHDILGFYPHNLEIYRVAFAHRSLSYRSKDRRNQETGRPLNNERLEYLGDAVLETVVSDIIYHHFDRRREGFLTATRSKVVSRETLNRLSEEMNILKLVRAAQGISTNHTNIGGNAFEALMGAIYLDRGFRYCRWFIEKRVMGRFIDLDKLANKEVNFKSKLLEWSQKNRINTAFNMEGGTGGERVFFTTVVIEGLVAGKGKGLSKKESQQIAAKEALTKLRREPLFLDSVFQAKEQRTAMEAEEAFALPHIDEIEDILTKEQGKGSKPKRAEQEAPVLETAADAPAASELSDGNETPAAKPRRRRSRSRSAKSVTEAVKTAPAAETEAQQPASEPEAKNPQTRRPQPPRTDEDTDAATGKPRRRRRSRAAKPAGDAASAQSSEADREAIIRAAEEAAFTE